MSTEFRGKVRDYYNRMTPIVLKDCGYTYQGGTLNEPRSSDVYRETNEWLAERAGIRPGMRVLDAGCGACGPAVDVARAVGDVTIDAVTISEEQAKAGRAHIAKNGMESRVRVHVGDYHHLPFEDGTFDVVYFFESSGYSDDKPALYREIFRLLKPNGTLYIKDMFAKDPLTTDLERQGLEAFNQIYAAKTDSLRVTQEAVQSAGFVDVEAADRSDVLGTRAVEATMVKFENGKPVLDETGMPVFTDLGKTHLHPYFMQQPDRDKDPIFFGEVKARRP